MMHSWIRYAAALAVLAVAVCLVLPVTAQDETPCAEPLWACIGTVGCQGRTEEDVVWCDAASVKQPIQALHELSANARLAELCRRKIEAKHAPKAYVCGLVALWKAKCVRLPEPGGSCPNASPQSE